MAGSSHDAADKRVARAVAQRLESLERAGVTHLPKSRARKTTAQAAAPSPPPPHAPEPVVEVPVCPPAPATPLSQNDRAAELDAIRQRVVKCVRCAELAKTRTQTVFGVGNVSPRLVFLGEAPGADEDRQGEPFVGRAGQLLNDIIRACTLGREDVYILNILKCRPPGNRNPLPEEADNCREYLDGQLAILQPEYICCLGTVAGQNLLKTDQSIGKLRGRFHLYHGIKVLCTYHPAYLLRNPPAKRQVWEDMQFLMAEMGIPLPRK